MTWLSDRLEALLKRDNMSLRQLEREAGVANGYLSMVRTGRRKKVGEKVARRLSEYSGHPTEYWLYENFENDDKRRLQNLKIRAIMNDILESVEIQAYIPVYDCIPVKKGVTPVDHIAVTQTKPAQTSWQGFRIKGLSLAQEIKEGDIIIVDTELIATDDDIVLVLHDSVPVLSYFRNVLKGADIYGVVVSRQTNYR